MQIHQKGGGLEAGYVSIDIEYRCHGSDEGVVPFFYYCVL